MSTLVENVAKVKSAHDALSASIEAKGVSVPAGTKLTGMPALVDQIQTGGELTPNTSKVTLHADHSTHIDVNKIIVADTSQMTDFEAFFAEDKQLTSFTFPENFAPNATKFVNFCYFCNNLTSFEYAEDFG